MMTTISPIQRLPNGQHHGFRDDHMSAYGHAHAYGQHYGSIDEGARSPLSPTSGPLSSFGFFKNLGADKKPAKVDGQPPKRRGPKPDSKPALTRRQELNRQAQRTHRERKETYIKALEQEVLRLKETFASTARERNALAAEVEKLRAILAAHGIHYDTAAVPMLGNGRLSSLPLETSYGSSSGSISGSYQPAPSSATEMSPPPLPGRQLVPGAPRQSVAQLPPQASVTGVDYDTIGVDFVLTLERPCMDHMQYLMVRSNESNGTEQAEISGHALMATCPPESHVAEHGMSNIYPTKMPDMGVPDLMKLLDLSNRLPLDGEITPIMAWAMILRHERVHEITDKEFGMMRDNLHQKVRCYGFGAVLEEFEVNDAINLVLAAKESQGCYPA